MTVLSGESFLNSFEVWICAIGDEEFDWVKEVQGCEVMDEGSSCFIWMVENLRDLFFGFVCLTENFDCLTQMRVNLVRKLRF